MSRTSTFVNAFDGRSDELTPVSALVAGAIEKGCLRHDEPTKKDRIRRLTAVTPACHPAEARVPW
jgi:hypothetical protein